VTTRFPIRPSTPKLSELPGSGTATSAGGGTPLGALLRLLTEKFGSLAEEHRSRLAGADEATLDRWLDRIFDAATIDDLFRE